MRLIGFSNPRAEEEEARGNPYPRTAREVEQLLCPPVSLKQALAREPRIKKTGKGVRARSENFGGVRIVCGDLPKGSKPIGEERRRANSARSKPTSEE